MEADLAAQPPEPWADLDFEELKRRLGPIVWQLRSRDDGFVGTSYLLRAAE